MLKPEDKLKLMLELGMEDAADKYAEAHSLTTMKFRPISSDKIEELLSVEYQEMSNFNEESLIGMTFLGMVFGLFGGFITCASDRSTLMSWSIAIGCVAVSFVIGYWMAKPKMETHTADVCQMPLKEWDDNLPYGALLSVKEAKAQGYKDFTIFFPAKDDSRYADIKRLKEDPIIVAHKKGHGQKMYNIFAWDDGKVYE